MDDHEQVDCGFDAMLDSNLEFRIEESWAWIANSEFFGSIGNSCIVHAIVSGRPPPQLCLSGGNSSACMRGRQGPPSTLLES